LNVLSTLPKSKERRSHLRSLTLCNLCFFIQYTTTQLWSSLSTTTTTTVRTSLVSFHLAMLSKALRQCVCQHSNKNNCARTLVLSRRHPHSHSVSLVQKQYLRSEYSHKYATQAQSVEASHPQPVPLSKLAASWLNGESSYYIEELYEKWKENPSSVHPSWSEFFTRIISGVPPEEAYPIRVCCFCFCRFSLITLILCLSSF
jgi:hypothetical protein